jgi:hypothetical protein
MISFQRRFDLFAAFHVASLFQDPKRIARTFQANMERQTDSSSTPPEQGYLILKSSALVRRFARG